MQSFLNWSFGTILAVWVFVLMFASKTWVIFFILMACANLNVLLWMIISKATKEWFDEEEF